jgi:D-threo-aldose 1-dehydrogenase
MEDQMSQMKKRVLGRTGVEVSEVGFGGAPLGDLFEPVSEADAQATLERAWERGVRYYDTSPFYGYGKSEHRLGHCLRYKQRSDFVLSTKVGRVFKPSRAKTFDSGFWVGGMPFDFYHDYTYDGIMRSWEDSTQRLGINKIDLLLIHDLDSFFMNQRVFDSHMGQLVTSGWRALEELRDAGLIKGIGAGINQMDNIPHFLEAVDVDFFLVAVPYTLLAQQVLEEEFPACVERGVHFVIGAVFASGILVSGPVEGAKYAYEPAGPEILEKTRKIEAVCQRYDVPLAAAALQFPLGHANVASVIPGAMAPWHIDNTVDLYGHDIPADLWAELKAEGLLHKDAPTP